MNYTEIVKKVKSLFATEEVVAVFADVKTTDGALLRVDGEITVDATIQMINEDATLSPLADGDYALENGSMLVVADGKIVEIKNEKTFVDPNTGEQVAELESIQPEVEEEFVEAVPATEEMPEGETEVEVEEPEMDVNAEIEGLKSEIEGIKEVIMQLVAAIETLTSGQATMSKQVEDFSKEPAVKTSIKEVAKFEKKVENTKTKNENQNWASKVAQIRNK
jgi:hypothetical protein